MFKAIIDFFKGDTRPIDRPVANSTLGLFTFDDDSELWVTSPTDATSVQFEVDGNWSKDQPTIGPNIRLIDRAVSISNELALLHESVRNYISSYSNIPADELAKLLSLRIRKVSLSFENKTHKELMVVELDSDDEYVFIEFVEGSPCVLCVD